ncbi:DNA-directed primase/polymerase protein isoform X6 [Canna indica]|uniref:DNA-directed primase/polymerase protein isoform X6 n=1 Tax=Canna indica TaxID=4628 RepID=A0AAQ3QI30_9LILI|nr:DNA-directed primase/polymerase protein isoform X6 [Canna indica]
MKEYISIVSVWIQMPGLPLKFLNQKILLQLAAVIGKPVKIDDFTLSGTRGKYARVCVLLDLKKPIEQGFWVEAKGSCFFQTVAYENLPNVCFNYERIEHKEEQCTVDIKIDTGNEVNSEQTKDDFLEDGIDPEASRHSVRKGGKLRKGAMKNSNIINVPIMFSNPKMKKKRFMEETSAMGNDGDPDKVGDIEKNLKDTENKLALLEKKEEQDTLSENELMLRRSLLNKRTALGRQRQIKWWSGSRKNWIEGGEKNTRYYHNVVKLRRQFNLIEELEVENKIVKDSNEVVGHMAKCWKVLTDIKGNGGLGIRDLKTMKKALNAKRILPLLNSNDSMWTSLLLNKYGKLHPWGGEKSKQISWNMRSVIKSMEALKEGFRMKVENGKKAEIWNDPWIGELPLNIWPTYINVVELEKFSMVSELMENEAWCMSIIEKCFSEILAQEIAAIQLNIDGIDRWIWVENWKGELTVKNAYFFLKNKEEKVKGLEIDWKKIWKIRCSERAKMFIWEMVWGKLPTSNWFAQFSGVEADKCYVCKEGIDDWKYIFFNCKFSSRYWELAEKALCIKFRFKDRWNEGKWLDETEGFESESAELILAFLSVSMWMIWKNRNKEKFEGKCWDLHEVLEKSTREVLEYNEVSSMMKSKGEVKSKDETNGIKAELILNCDAAWRGTKVARLGFILENCSEEVLLGGYGADLANNPLLAEAKAIFFGLDNVRKKGLKGLIVSSDCLSRFGACMSEAAKLKSGKQISPIIFYGSPHGAPIKKPSRLLRLLHEIHFDLKEENDFVSRKQVWATFPRQEEAIRFLKGHSQVKLFSYQDHLSGQRRFLVSTYSEFWRRYRDMDPKLDFKK